jgi:hypothetical protein
MTSMAETAVQAAVTVAAQWQPQLRQPILLLSLLLTSPKQKSQQRSTLCQSTSSLLEVCCTATKAPNLIAACTRSTSEQCPVRCPMLNCRHRHSFDQSHLCLFPRAQTSLTYVCTVRLLRMYRQTCARVCANAKFHLLYDWSVPLHVSTRLHAVHSCLATRSAQVRAVIRTSTNFPNSSRSSP